MYIKSSKDSGKDKPTRNDVVFINLKGDEDIRQLYQVMSDFTDLYDTEEEDTEKLKLVKDGEKVLKPKDIKKTLDEYVIGQENVKKVLAVAVYNHYKRINNKSDINLKKSNIMLIGPTGSGKTLFAQTIAKTLELPLAIVDATSITEAGYVGDDVEVCLERLYAAAHGDLKLVEKGIVFVDEIDKLRTGQNLSNKKDVSGEGVQQALLKLIEGSEAVIKNPEEKKVKIDTSNILFILGGAFAGIESYVEERKVPEANGIGFSATVTNPEKKRKPKMGEVTVNDLKDFGIIPELLGRVPNIAKLEALSVKDLRRILTEPKDSIVSHYEELFKLDGSTIEFTKKTLNKVAKQALKENTGARGLQAILEKELMDLMFAAEADQTYII